MQSTTRVAITPFDPHFKVFHELMGFKVREILVVASPYDAFIMEEDGSLASRIINEYHGLNLSQPPRITRVATSEEALSLLEEFPFDLVLTLSHVGRMDCCQFGKAIKSLRNIPVILLAHSLRETDLPMITPGCGIDAIFIWCCDADILLAIVKSVEDQANVDFDTRRAMVRVILLVEDSPLYRSRLLPMLYAELVKQTQSLLDEGLNQRHRLLKMRARPKILTATSYEEAWDLFQRYQQTIFCVMSDVRFPRGGILEPNAGFALLQAIRGKRPELPLLLLSAETRNQERAARLKAMFVDKNGATLQEDIHNFFQQYLGFGAFVFRLPNGSGVGRAPSLKAFEEELARIPVESLFYHTGYNHFCHWLMARAELDLAARLDTANFGHITSGEKLRALLVTTVHAYRKWRQRGIITQFSRDDFDPDISEFVRIGRGSLGGKGRGLAFISSQLQRLNSTRQQTPDYRIRVPRSAVITNTGFDDFIDLNHLRFQEGEPDASIQIRFLNGRLPDWLYRDLEAYLARIHYPLSVRSSSMLEDAHFRPYAGLYSTFMLTNGDPDFAVRLQQLTTAVKLVYASTWFAAPRAFSRSVGQTRPDSMGIIIQALAGNHYGKFFYPAISGVAQSWNYYPLPPMQPQDGVAHICLGFGKTVVEGEKSLRFSPPFPANLPQFSSVDDFLENSQQTFYALDCSRPEQLDQKNSNLVQRTIQEASQEAPIRMLSSTYIPEEHRIRDLDLPGPKVLTFAPLLKYDLFPLPNILQKLLALGKEGLGCEVEIEFAVDLGHPPQPSSFYCLQIRPIVTHSGGHRLPISDQERSDAFLFSTQALGHGLYNTIRDIVLVRPATFDPAKTKEITLEISEINRKLHHEQIPYLLMGPGRWGTADPWLGIPIRWQDISGVTAIVELLSETFRVEPSQGSHFFQNISSLGIPYLMVADQAKPKKSCPPDYDFIDWNMLRKVVIVHQGEYTMHARTSHPFTLKVDGFSSTAVALMTNQHGEN